MRISIPPDNILLIDKPKGITSFDVIRKLRKETGIRKMGHAGTLDPIATGLLIIGVGPGTKKMNDFIKLDKTYQTEILIGVKTDTADLDGEFLEEVKVENIDRKKLNSIINNLTGQLKLPVPLYSAVKVDGVPLYKRARGGEKNLTPPVKQMTIYSAKIHDLRKADRNFILDLELHVSSGTYVRSIAEEIGRRLGYPATVKELRRLTVGDYSVEDARKL